MRQSWFISGLACASLYVSACCTSGTGFLGGQALRIAATGDSDFSSYGVGAQGGCECDRIPNLYGEARVLYFFEDNATSFGSSLIGRYAFPVSGVVRPYGVGGLHWSYFDYGSDYEAGNSDTSQNATGPTLGVGAAYRASDSQRILPYAEVGLNTFVLGDDFDTEWRLNLGFNWKFQAGGSD